jgi:hypothetical protein
VSKPEVKVGQEWVSRSARVRVIKTAGSSVVVSDVRYDGGLSRTRSLFLSSLLKGYRLVAQEAGT